jgi:hypothetical protein
MPTAIEQSYLDQGYVLQDGLTWKDIARTRARWDIAPIYVPVALMPGICTGWGVPFVGGVPLRHR